MSSNLAELADEEFVFPTKSFNVTVQFMDACRRVGFEPKVAYQTGSFESVKDFVREGLGISILPRMARDVGGNDGVVTIDIEEAPTRELNLIRAKDRSLTGVTRALIDHVVVSLSDGTARDRAPLNRGQMSRVSADGARPGL